MPKLLCSTWVAIFLTAGSVFAQPTATSNNSSCDIGVTPAATLLLPYFEVDTAAAALSGATTLFTITNTSRYPQIAHVTLWTDWAFPVLQFNIFLTGYDVQGINLFDVIVRGRIVPTGTSISSTRTISYGPGSAPLDNWANPNFVATGPLAAGTTCVALPSVLPADLVTAVRNALTTGAGGAANCSTAIGNNHGTRAVGYATVDVVSYCSTQFPTDSDGAYFLGPTAPILFDNILLGDYEQIGLQPGFNAGPTAFDAQGNSMVHIRAVPEGGLSGAGGGGFAPTNLPFTFYDRYTPDGTRTADRRQPLPSTWAARYIQGGTQAFSTEVKIWREGLTGGLPSCGNVRKNSDIDISSMVRFDEHENSWGFDTTCTLCIPVHTLAATSRVSSANSPFPLMTGTDVSGWLYLNLSSNSRRNGGTCESALSAQRPGFNSGSGFPGCFFFAPGTSGSRWTSQNWVTAGMFGGAGNSVLGADLDAAWLGNGCTPADFDGAVIAPSTHARGALVCPASTPTSNCGASTRPAAVNP